MANHVGGDPVRDDRLLAVDTGTEVATGPYVMDTWPFGDSDSSCVMAVGSLLSQISDLKALITAAQDKITQFRKWYAEWLEGHHAYAYRSANEILRENRLMDGYDSDMRGNNLVARFDSASQMLNNIEAQLQALRCPDDEGTISSLSGDLQTASQTYSDANATLQRILDAWIQFKSDCNCPEQLDPLFN